MTLYPPKLFYFILFLFFNEPKQNQRSGRRQRLRSRLRLCFRTVFTPYIITSVSRCRHWRPTSFGGVKRRDEVDRRTEPSQQVSGPGSSPLPFKTSFTKDLFDALFLFSTDFVEHFAMPEQNSTSPGQRRESQQSWTGSEIFHSPFPKDYTLPQNAAGPKLSGKAWGRVKKFLLCKNGFPSSIYYIVGNEFCERFSYYGMKAILILYLTRVLSLGDNTATAVFHSFSMLCYFTPLFGAMLADGWLGKYR